MVFAGFKQRWCDSIHAASAISGKMRGRGLATHPLMPRLRKWSRQYFMPVSTLNGLLVRVETI